jgi:glycosyltransferase involved in cell wall biosynthesis
MGEVPLVSAIIATYKRAGLVPKAIESVRRQTYRNLEIIVVDDESPDNTRDIVQAIPDDRIHYIRHEKNKGLPAGRNTGIRAATGEYIAFLDDDDEWRGDKIERQLRLIREKGYGAVLCGVLVDGWRLSIHPHPTISLDDLRRGSFEPSGMLVKAAVIKELLFDENLRQGEDWDVFIRIAERYTVGYDPEPLLLYSDGGHVRMTNEAREMTPLELEKRTAILHKHRQFFGEKWFNYHLAGNFISHIGSRRNKMSSITYAIKRCGLRPVFAVLIDKVRRYVRARTVDRA